MNLIYYSFNQNLNYTRMCYCKRIFNGRPGVNHRVNLRKQLTDKIRKSSQFVMCCIANKKFK